MPPRNPANTGTPTAPISTYTTSLMVPYFEPRRPPVRNTARVARFTGTGVNPSGTETKEPMAVTAAKRPQSTRYVVFEYFPVIVLLAVVIIALSFRNVFYCPAIHSNRMEISPVLRVSRLPSGYMTSRPPEPLIPSTLAGIPPLSSEISLR